MVRKVWFQLIDEESRHEFAGTAAASVLTSVDVKGIGDFRNKVHAKFDHTQPRGSDILARVAPFQLKIYANTAAYDAQDPPLNENHWLVLLVVQRKMHLSWKCQPATF
ncbi:hypothetical protein Plhal703r1_c71g0171161 [Plasmopara halstedii]